MAKKLLNRFENSPKVWTIKQEIDENGHFTYVTKTYNSIADAHRDNPKISCSHIEDYCNGTYFNKKNHWFAYVGCMMAPSINELINGWSLDPTLHNLFDEYPFKDVRSNRIYNWMEQMWNDIANEFIAKTYKSSSVNPKRYYADSLIMEALSKLEYRDVALFMKQLYNAGWHKYYLDCDIINWCNKNLTREKLLMSDAEPIAIVQKPEKRYWCRQSYKQENYL